MRKIALLIAGAAVAVVAWLVPAASPAQAVTAQQCINAASNPNGSVATQCHQAGWTVNQYIVVDPGSWVRWYDGQLLRKCGAEYGGPWYPCWWNFWEPPSAGSKYWFDVGGHIRYVNGIHWGA